MSCEYPQNTPLNGYRKGCRCERCRGAKAATDRKRSRPSPCRRCRGPKKIGGWYCDTCSPLVLVERIAARVEIGVNGCWVYEGSPRYVGLHMHRTQRPTTAHRVMYEHFTGAVPDGLELDHLCRNTACVNPDHLEPVTRAENVRRALAAKRKAAL